MLACPSSCLLREIYENLQNSRTVLFRISRGNNMVTHESPPHSNCVSVSPSATSPPTDSSLLMVASPFCHTSNLKATFNHFLSATLTSGQVDFHLNRSQIPFYFSLAARMPVPWFRLPFGFMCKSFLTDVPAWNLDLPLAEVRSVPDKSASITLFTVLLSVLHITSPLTSDCSWSRSSAGHRRAPYSHYNMPFLSFHSCPPTLIPHSQISRWPRYALETCSCCLGSLILFPTWENSTQLSQPSYKHQAKQMCVLQMLKSLGV